MTHSTRRAQARLTAFGEVVLTFPFHAGLVDDLKAHIPYRYRTYDPSTKEWCILAEFAEVAVTLMVQHFPDAELPLKWRTRQRSTHDGASTALASTEPYRVLHLLPSAPRELVDAAYRTLARLAHPDLGGDTASMQSLNLAYAVLKARVPA